MAGVRRSLSSQSAAQTPMDIIIRPMITLRIKHWRQNHLVIEVRECRLTYELIEVDEMFARIAQTVDVHEKNDQRHNQAEDGKRLK